MMHKLLLFVLISLHVSASWAQLPFDNHVTVASKKTGLDKNLIHAVINTESSHRNGLCSHAKACGLMQIIPATAERFGLPASKRMNTYRNVMTGSTYLAWLLDYFDGNLKYALAGYNAGEHKVKKYNGIPPYKETQNYVKKVLRKYKQYSNGKLSYIKTKKKKTHRFWSNTSPSSKKTRFNSAPKKEPRIKKTKVSTTRVVNQKIKRVLMPRKVKMPMGFKG